MSNPRSELISTLTDQLSLFCGQGRLCISPVSHGDQARLVLRVLKENRPMTEAWLQSHEPEPAAPELR